MDLERFVTPIPGRSDEALARQAVVEGEAVALTLQLTLRRQGRDLADLPDVKDLSRAIENSATGPTLMRAPRYVRAVLTFPYARGLAFVHALRQRAPWTAMATLYGDPPRSSSQILHPDSYFDRREDPVPVALPDLAAVLGPGARRVIEDDVGEFTLGQVMATFLGDRTVLPHWRGDRYALWETAGGQACLVARFAWRDDAAAGAFAAAYDRLLETKHGLPAGAGTRVAAGQAFVVERRGAEVLVLERAPLALVASLRRVLWGETGARLQRTPARLSRITPASITAAPSAISRTR
jgi:hypothetical protein